MKGEELSGWLSGTHSSGADILFKISSIGKEMDSVSSWNRNNPIRYSALCVSRGLGVQMHKI